MSRYVLDQETNTVFEYDKIGKNHILRGININGLFRLKKLDKRIVPINSEDIEKYVSNNKWIERLVSLMTSKRTVHINFNATEEQTPKVKTKANSKEYSYKKPDTTDYVSISEICLSMGIDPKKGRAILRKQISKPQQGWKWPQSEVEKIKELLGGK